MATRLTDEQVFQILWHAYNEPLFSALSNAPSASPVMLEVSTFPLPLSLPGPSHHPSLPELTFTFTAHQQQPEAKHPQQATSPPVTQDVKDALPQFFNHHQPETGQNRGRLIPARDKLRGPQREKFGGKWSGKRKGPQHKREEVLPGCHASRDFASSLTPAAVRGWRTTGLGPAARRESLPVAALFCTEDSKSFPRPAPRKFKQSCRYILMGHTCPRSRSCAYEHGLLG